MADKKRTEPNWQDVRTFLALGRRGSLSAAARMLGVNHATIARRVQSLERSLGERLVERRPDGYDLTSAGKLILDTASGMETIAEGLTRRGASETPRGLVRINAPPGLAAGFLVPQLARIPGKFPTLDLDLATDLRAVSLDRREADIALRFISPRDNDLIARRLTAVGFGFYASPDTCAKTDGGLEPTFIGFDEASRMVSDTDWITRNYPKARIAFRTNNHFAQAQAAQAGAGVVLLPHYIGRTMTGLRRCLKHVETPSSAIWLMIRRQDRSNLGIRTIFQEICNIFKEHEPLFTPDDSHQLMT